MVTLLGRFGGLPGTTGVAGTTYNGRRATNGSYRLTVRLVGCVGWPLRPWHGVPRLGPSSMTPMEVVCHLRGHRRASKRYLAAFRGFPDERIANELHDECWGWEKAEVRACEVWNVAWDLSSCSTASPKPHRSDPGSPRAPTGGMHANGHSLAYFSKYVYLVA